MALSDDVRLYSELMRTDPEGFAEALSRAGLGIFVADWSGDTDLEHQLDYNSTLRTAFGLPETGTVSREFGFQYLVHPDDVERMRMLADEHVPNGQPYRFRQRMKRATGRYFPCITNVKPVMDPSGKPVKMIGVISTRGRWKARS